MKKEDIKKEIKFLYWEIERKNKEEIDYEKFDIDDLWTFCLIISIEILMIILILLYNI